MFNFSWISTSLSKILSLGTSFALDANGLPDLRKSKRIILSNQISLSVALLNLPYVLIYPFIGKGILGWLEIPVFLGYASVHRLNGKGYTLFSRLFLISLANVDILTYTIALGRASEMHFLLLLCGWAPLALFDMENPKSLFYGIGLSSLFFLGCEALVPLHGTDPLPPQSELFMANLIISTAVLVQILFTAYFIRANRKTEDALADVSEIANTSDRAKGIFLSRMGNAIRFPIKQIFNSVNLLMKTQLQEQNRDTVRNIEISILDLSGIVDEVLDVTHIDAGKVSLVYDPFDLNNLVHSVLRPFEYQCENTPRSIFLELQSTLPERVIGDATRLKQILRNLIGNAIKFTAEGRIILRIHKDNGGKFNFEVEDSGIGIPTQLGKRIFEPFFQADGSTTRKYGGTGLGLFISKELVELMGGRLEYRPAATRGSIFRFSIKFQS